MTLSGTQTIVCCLSQVFPTTLIPPFHDHRDISLVPRLCGPGNETISIFFMCAIINLYVPSFLAVTVELVSMDPVTGVVGVPDVSVQENGPDPRLCARLTGGVNIARDVMVTLSTVTGGTAQGMVCLFVLSHL